MGVSGSFILNIVTVNDPVPVPEPHPSEGSYHWSFERFVTTIYLPCRVSNRNRKFSRTLRFVCVGLIPLTIAPFAAGSLNPVMDAVLCSLLVAHSHIGFQ